MWRKLPALKPVLTEQWVYNAVPDLIRKLVEDETEMLERLATLGCYPHSFNAKRTILNKFGIDEDTWK